MRAAAAAPPPAAEAAAEPVRSGSVCSRADEAGRRCRRCSDAADAAPGRPGAWVKPVAPPPESSMSARARAMSWAESSSRLGFSLAVSIALSAARRLSSGGALGRSGRRVVGFGFCRNWSSCPTDSVASWESVGSGPWCAVKANSFWGAGRRLATADLGAAACLVDRRLGEGPSGCMLESGAMGGSSSRSSLRESSCCARRNACMSAGSMLPPSPPPSSRTATQDFSPG
eukprot:scaffold87914_cov59-Phaeocystis_antarctica.AAC.1